MTIFLTLLVKIIPLYIFILLGYLANRYARVNREAIAILLIYILVPLVVFGGTTDANLNVGTLSLPFLFFFLACGMCFTFYKLAARIWSGSEKNIIAYCAGTGNTGYFGLPVAIALFGAQVAPLIILSMFGFLVYEASLGFYITARGNLPIKTSIMRVLKLPTIYAFALGLLANILGIRFSHDYNSFFTHIQGAYSVLGIMLIGFGIGELSKLKFDIKFIGITFLARFIVWPLVIMLIIILDHYTLQLYNPQIYKVMLLMATVPLAANAVAFSTILKVHPEKMALAVLLSTLFALFYIPLVMTL